MGIYHAADWASRSIRVRSITEIIWQKKKKRQHEQINGPSDAARLSQPQNSRDQNQEVQIDELGHDIEPILLDASIANIKSGLIRLIVAFPIKSLAITFVIVVTRFAAVLVNQVEKQIGIH